MHGAQSYRCIVCRGQMYRVVVVYFLTVHHGYRGRVSARYTHIPYITRIIGGCTRASRARHFTLRVPIWFRVGHTWCVFLRLHCVRVPAQAGPASHQTRRNKHIPRRAEGCASGLSYNGLGHRRGGSGAIMLSTILPGIAYRAGFCTPWGCLMVAGHPVQVGGGHREGCDDEFWRFSGQRAWSCCAASHGGNQRARVGRRASGAGSSSR